MQAVKQKEVARRGRGGERAKENEEIYKLKVKNNFLIDIIKRQNIFIQKIINELNAEALL